MTCSVLAFQFEKAECLPGLGYRGSRPDRDFLVKARGLRPPVAPCRPSRLHDPAEIASLRSAVAAVRQREVVRRAHFIETRGGAGEFERLRSVGAGIEGLRFAGSRDD